MVEDLVAAATAVDHFSALPDPIIHNILFYLFKLEGDGEHAGGRTSVLSKRWNHLWSTFPYLDYHYHPSYRAYVEKQRRKQHSSEGSEERRYKEEFLNLLESSIQPRFEKNSSILTFRMNLDFPDIDMLAPRMDRWLGMAVDKNVNSIFFSTSRYPDTGFEFCTGYRVPQKVFASGTLKQLRLWGCKIEKTLDIKLPRLQTLFFDQVFGLDDTMFQKLISGCPSIVSLSLQLSNGLKRVSITRVPHLKDVTFSKCYGLESIEIKAPSLDEFSLEVSKYQNQMREINLATCIALKVLRLSRVRMSFQNLESIISQVEVLDLISCHGLENIKLPIQNLKELIVTKCINFSIPKINLDFPPKLLLATDLGNHGRPLCCINNICHRLKVIHLHFPLESCDFIWWSNLKNSLAKSSISCDKLKLAIYNSDLYTIVHDKLTDVSLYSLFLDDILLKCSSMCISSRNHSDIVDDLLLENHSPTLSVVSSCNKPIELLSTRTLNIHGGSRLDFVPWWKYFLGFEISSQAVKYTMHPFLRAFLKQHSVGIYQTTTLTLIWN